LLPHTLYAFSRADDFDQAQDYHLFDCIECGCCSWVCPSHIPLVHYFRYAKTAIDAQDWAVTRTNQTRKNFEMHEARQVREDDRRRAARENKRTVSNQPGDEAGPDLQAEIQAAIRRTEEKRRQRKLSGTDPSSGPDNNGSPEQQ